MPLTAAPPAAADLTAADATATALLNCLVREICAPEHQTWPDARHLVVRLPRVGVALRARLARPPIGFTYRLAPPVEEPGRRGTGWVPVDWRRLADLVAGELELLSGQPNPEFLDQVRDSHRAIEAILATRRRPADGTSRFLESEQALVAGHRFHPAPKARQGEPAEWLPYAPEARASFAMRWLAVRADLVAGEGDLAPVEAVGPQPPPGHRLLPAHPWQLRLLAGRPLLRRAFAEGAIIDLGPAGPDAVPTSSVRTVYVPDADLFCKFSLDVRITNCVRKNAWYELAGSVALNRLLAPVFAELGDRFGGCALLGEPAYRAVCLADRRLYEGLAVILREGLAGRPGTPLVAASLADPRGLAALPALTTPEGALTWWDAYVSAVAAPVLHAFLAYGVVLEPHLQNVLVAVDRAGLPGQAVFRDLEGTKLVAGRWDLTGLPPGVREALTYDPGRGWNRVVYCLIVNHLAEVLAAVADLHPALEPEMWRRTHALLCGYAREHTAGLAPDQVAPLRALLAGVPLPAKANLRARWARHADRHATYVAVPSPFRPAPQGP